LADPSFELPCCDQFVADIAVDFAADLRGSCLRSSAA
jgi:hypothetical protein